MERLADVFGILPEIKSVKISPEGDRLLLLQHYQGKYMLVTKSLSNPNLAPNGIPISGGEYFWASWANNDRIVAGITHDNFQRYGRIRTLHDSLISLDWDGNNQINLTYDKSRFNFFDLGQGNVLDWLPEDPDHILVFIVRDIYKLNIYNNQYEPYHKTNLNERGFYIDDNGVLRYIVGQSKRGEYSNIDLYRKSDESDWLEIIKGDQKSTDNPLSFEGLTDNSSVIYMSKYDEKGVFSLYLFNTDSNQLIKKIDIATKATILGFSISKKGIFESYKYFNGQETTEYLSGPKQHVVNIIKTTFPNTNFSIQSVSNDNQKFTILISSPTEAGSYYMLDLSSNTLELIDYIYRDVEQYKLSQTEIIEFNSRDGVTIQGYLTTPKDKTARNLPTIILPHDGPTSRDIWRFDPLVQSLVLQGYAVLQLNYRGSTGYGPEFLKLAKGEWGNKILEDINDGALWMIQNGYANPEKICIFGKNYGGYAALQSAILNNNLYTCSAAFSPITDVFAKSKNLTGSYFSMRRNPDYSYTETEFENFRKKNVRSFRDVSPVQNIERLNTPVLILNAIENNGFKREQFLRFKRLMDTEGKNITYVDYTLEGEEIDETSIFSNVLSELSSFFEKHLK